MKNFLKKSELQLINGGYLANKTEVPVTNKSFIKAQKHAEYIVTFAKLAKDKDFVGKKADCLQSLVADTKKALAEKDTVFVKKPKKSVRKLTDELAKEAMAFIAFEKDTSKNDKINLFLQQFKVLSEFEDFGLFFKEGIVKLNKIYTLKEVVAAVETTIDILD